MKKSTCFMTITLLSVSLLTACNTKPKENTTGQKNNTNTGNNIASNTNGYLDGTYTGTGNKAAYGNDKARVVVRGGRIASITFSRIDTTGKEIPLTNAGGTVNNAGNAINNTGGTLNNAANRLTTPNTTTTTPSTPNNVTTPNTTVPNGVTPNAPNNNQNIGGAVQDISQYVGGLVNSMLQRQTYDVTTNNVDARYSGEISNMKLAAQRALQKAKR